MEEASRFFPHRGFTMRKYTTIQLIALATEGLLVPAEFGTDRATALATWTNTSGLPAIHFSWRQQHQLWDLTKEQAADLKKLGFDVQPSYDKEYLCAYGVETETSHIWLCNFRRYGWAWSPDEKGEQCYGHGVTYANSELPITFIADTKELVVRDSLVATWAKLVGGDLPGFFNTAEVHVLLRDLLSDALKNMSDHATPWQGRLRYMGPEDSKGFYIPVSRSSEMQNEFPMPESKMPAWHRSSSAKEA